MTRNLYQRYLLVSCATTLFGMITFAVARLNPAIALVAVPATITSYLLFRNNTLSPIPRWIINALLILATLSTLRIVNASPDEAISILGEFLVWLTVIKLFESHTPRNQAPALVLSILLIVASVLSAVTLDVGILVIIYAPLATAWAVLFQLYRGAHDRHNARLAHTFSAHDTERPPFPDTLTKQQTRHARRTIAAGATAAALCATVIFILMPRNVTQGALGQLNARGTASTTGLTNDSIQLGQQTNIQESEETVLAARIQQLTIRDNRIEPVSLRAGSFLLRAISLDRYDPRTGSWTRSPEAASQALIRPDTTRGGIAPAETTAAYPLTRGSRLTADQLRFIRQAGILQLTINPLRPAARDELVSLWFPARVDFENIRQPNLQTNIADATIEFATDSSRARQSVYTITTLQNHPLGINNPVTQQLPTRLHNWYQRSKTATNPFADDPRFQPVRDLADRILQTLNLPIEPDETFHARAGLPQLDAPLPPQNAERIVNAFVSHLERNFTYSLQLRTEDPDLDPTIDFILNTRTGHCEYFASALAALCRAVNIDARVVLGYVATEYDPVENAFIVREKHAHAWVEAEVQPGVWKTFDPSPLEQTEPIHRPDPSVFAAALRWFDRLESLWVRSVISFDQEQQARLFGLSRDGTIDTPDWLTALTAPPDPDDNHLLTIARSTISVAIVFAALAITSAIAFIAARRIARFRRRQQRQRTSAIAARNTDAARRAYDDALKALANAGLEKPASLPPLTHAKRIAASNPNAARTFHDIATAYYNTRFADRDHDTTPARINELARTLREHLAPTPGHTTA